MMERRGDCCIRKSMKFCESYFPKMGWGSNIDASDFCRWDDEKTPEGIMPFRAEQLVFRNTEVYEAYRDFKEIVATGEAGSTRRETDTKMDNDEEEFFKQWKDRVDCESLAMTGHSFGGATAVSSIFFCFCVIDDKLTSRPND